MGRRQGGAGRAVAVGPTGRIPLAFLLQSLQFSLWLRGEAGPKVAILLSQDKDFQIWRAFCGMR